MISVERNVPEILSNLPDGAPDGCDKHMLFELLKPIARAIAKTFGHECEVLIHDFSDLEHSIVCIEGNVTGRQVGGSLTDLGLAKLRSGDLEDVFNYTTYTDDGQTLRSSSIFLRDQKGRPYGALCININITPFLAFEHTLRSICRGEDGNKAVVETFSDDINEILDVMLAEAAHESGKSLSSMTKEEKVTLIAILDKRGAFQVKKAVPVIAGRLKVSRYTIYNYLNEARESD